MATKRYLFYISQNYAYAILRPLQSAILARGEQVAWFLEGKEVNADLLNVDEYRLTSIDEIKNYNPVAVFYPANIAPTFLPGINVAIFHGFDAGKVDKKGNNDHFKIRNCFDLYCTQGPSTTEAFLALAKQHKHFKVTETGWCALDRLYLKDESQKANKPTILLCSTFSKKLSCAPHLFDTVKRLSQTGRWNWLVQFHPKMPIEIVNQYKSIQNDHLSFVEADDVIPLLQKADVMVCDTSSVLIMFLLLGKPVVTYNNIAPENYLLDIDNVELLEQTIETALQKPTQLMGHIKHFIKMTHPYNDGNSSVRVLSAVDEVLSCTLALDKKPIDFFRQFKMRKKLNYWQW
ncbi:MAG: CDP-glycerol glycerophosphotransferase family protein [Colwellia sp.]